MIKYIRTWNENTKWQKNHENINWCVQSQINKRLISSILKIDIKR